MSSPRSIAWLAEILGDAEACPRLSAWEETFCCDMRERLAAFGLALQLSGKQWVVLERIETKVYAT